MPVELQVPHVGESIYEVTIGEWLKGEGQFVQLDEPVVALETDKASLDVPAPVTGTITQVLKQPGDTAQVGETIAFIEPGEAPPDGGAAPAAASSSSEQPKTGSRTMTVNVGGGAGDDIVVMPAARRLLSERGLRPQDITPTGPGRRLLKEDVLRHIEMKDSEPKVAASQAAPRPAAPSPAPASAAPAQREEIVAMSPLRRRIAERLVQSQQTAAMLTTFNEVDMSEIFALRKSYKEAFTERHGTKLGFMSFFVKATIEALKEFPALNAEVRGTNIVYKRYYNVGVAVGGGKGLVVPVIKDADRLSFAGVEQTIRDFAVRAQKNKIRPDELQGGTFTISNGGVYGSLLSTPIINPPQAAILGMHGIQERAVVRDGVVVVRPMMYLAVTYDHRLVDGRESVTFLRRIKDCIEHPSRILLEV
ncbi:MAG: 2-oxoglutarate dehydrogenase complex dihydrolipoyllysine-residue succinyltransferase [Planctomycetes bacterium]|nr:2-oxoglutarate dehydrogenase complex dihydrolipoyllysine-residue succinyltransferase [Planctomycetota bacterium]